MAFNNYLRLSGAQNEDNSLYMWGDNTYGQLGIGSTGSNRNAPVRSNFCQDPPQITAVTVQPLGLAPAQVDMNVTATGCVKRVEFWRNGSKISGCDDATRPYRCLQSNVAAGSHSYQIKVVDSMDVVFPVDPIVVPVNHLSVLRTGVVSLSNVSLDSAGILDWKHFPDMNRKNLSTDNLGIWNSGSTSATIQTPTFSWSGGTPTTQATGVKGASRFTLPNSSASLTAAFPSSTSTRRARVYFSVGAAQVRISPLLGSFEKDITLTPADTPSSRFIEVEYRSYGGENLLITFSPVSSTKSGHMAVQASVLR